MADIRKIKRTFSSEKLGQIKEMYSSEKLDQKRNKPIGTEQRNQTSKRTNKKTSWKQTLSLILLVASIGFLASLASVQGISFDLIFGGQADVFQIEQSDLFRKEVNLTGDKISLKILEKGNRTIENVLVYLCKNSNPSECTNKKPIKYRRTVDSEFLKTDVLENEEGSIILFLELSFSEPTGQKKSWWLADLILIEKNQVVDTEKHSVLVDLKTNLNDTKSILTKTGMLPLNFFNSIQVRKNFYQISGSEKKEDFVGKKSLNFTHSKLENSLQKIEGYSFLFPADPLLSPISIYGIKEKCGDYVCGLGESYNTCWSDCRCPTGQLPGSEGCTDKAIKIIIDSEQKTVNCILGDDFCSIIPSKYSLKFHLENAPIDYTLNTEYFKLGDRFISDKRICMPDKPPKLQKIDDKNYVFVNNATNYTCGLPVFKIKKEEIGTLSYTIYLSLSYKTQNGTETREAVGQTSINFVDITSDSRQRLLSLQQKLAERADLPRWLEYVSKGIKIIGYTLDTISVGTCLCCAAWFCSWGAACPTCASSVKSALIVEAINQLVKAALAQCTGIYKPAVFGIPLGDDMEIEGGSGRDAAAALSSTCREIKRSQEAMRQNIGEANQMQQLDVTEFARNLIWVNGENSGYATSTLCGREKTQIYFTFEQFECNKDLWFNLNSDERPVCDCSSRRFVKQTLLGDSCSCLNTPTYSWLLDNSTGVLLGKQMYNTTNFHVLYNSTADLLFRNSGELSITVYCDSETFKVVKDTFKLATYKPICSEAAGQTGPNIFNPGSLLGGNLSVI